MHDRAYVEELKSLLPRGEQVLCAPISRDGTARLWIEGQPDEDSLTRLITYIEFMRRAWCSPKAEEPKSLDPDSSRPTPEEVGGVLESDCTPYRATSRIFSTARMESKPE